MGSFRRSSTPQRKPYALGVLTEEERKAPEGVGAQKKAQGQIRGVRAVLKTRFSARAAPNQSKG